VGPKGKKTFNMKTHPGRKRQKGVLAGNGEGKDGATNRSGKCTVKLSNKLGEKKKKRQNKL